MDDLKLVSRKSKKEGTVVDVNGVKIGGKEIVVIAGPCAVESEEQLTSIAKGVISAGAKIVRAGTYKLRKSPYSFEGLGQEGLDILDKVRKKLGIIVDTEIMDTRHIEEVSKKADILRVGARNMRNYHLLKALGKINNPIILKRGMDSTVEEWLLAAEHIMKEGNHNVILCERGIRTFETATRNTLDLSAIPVVKKLSHLPVLVDPSHAAGIRDYVIPMSKAAIAAGADGLIVEVHNDPDNAKVDGPQQLTIEMFKELMKDLGEMARVVGRDL